MHAGQSHALSVLERSQRVKPTIAHYSGALLLTQTQTALLHTRHTVEVVQRRDVTALEFGHRAPAILPGWIQM